MLPNKTTLTAMAWTLAALAAIYRIRTARDLLTG